MDKFINYYEPVFRNNYNLGNWGIGFTKLGHLKIHYCKNNNKWLVFRDGFEIGELNEVGIKRITAHIA